MNANYQLITVFSDIQNRLLGNTAAVVRLQNPISESSMQQVAADFNQPATAFVWPAFDNHAFHIRWYAPDGEIGLCGHGSLAAVACLDQTDDPVTLHYKDGKIRGQKQGERQAWIDIAAITNDESKDIPSDIEEALGVEIKNYYPTSNKHIVLLHNEKAVKTLSPDFAKMRTNPIFGWIVTAKGEEVDFVSRTFVPHVQQLEDPATGSSHACLAPFWSARLEKSNLRGIQLSKRGGYFSCMMHEEGKTVRMTGESLSWAEGEISIQD
jgi:PhzF family phenazine biosynthesis protein